MWVFTAILGIFINFHIILRESVCSIFSRAQIQKRSPTKIAFLHLFVGFRVSANQLWYKSITFYELSRISSQFFNLFPYLTAGGPRFPYCLQSFSFSILSVHAVVWTQTPLFQHLRYALASASPVGPLFGALGLASSPSLYQRRFLSAIRG